MPVYCITWAEHSGWVEPKQDFLDSRYPGLIHDIIATSSREDKIKYIREFCFYHGIALEDVLLVEDHPDTVNMAVCDGITVMTASEVNVLYDCAE